MTIGERVTRLRKRYGWSQTDLAREAGIPVSIINMLESGARSGENLRIETARKLAQGLRVTLDRLCGEREDEGELLPAEAA